MKLTVTAFGKIVLGIETEQSIHAQDRQKRKDAFSQEMQILKMQRAGQKGGISGNVYNNCVFGQPFRINVPVGPQTINGTRDEAINRVITSTGLPKEVVERMVEAWMQYWNDKNHGSAE